MRRLAAAVVVLVAALTGCGGQEAVDASATGPPGSFVAVLRDDHVVVMDDEGHRTADLATLDGTHLQDATIAIAADNRSVYVGRPGPDCTPTVTRITTDGRTETFAEHASAPVTLRDDRVAMLKYERDGRICRRTAVVLADGRGKVLAEHALPADVDRVGGALPASPIAAAPDGTTVVVVAEKTMQSVALDTGTWRPATPVTGGSTRPRTPTTARSSRSSTAASRA